MQENLSRYPVPCHVQESMQHFIFHLWHNEFLVTVLHYIMPPPLGAGGIVFSGCPSVPSLKYPLSTCTWVRLSIRPTVTVLRHVGPSVRPERFSGICRRAHGGNDLKFCMLMYLDHYQNWQDYSYGLLIFLILPLFWLSENGKIWGFRAFAGEPMEEMTWHFACWCIVIIVRTD